MQYIILVFSYFFLVNNSLQVGGGGGAGTSLLSVLKAERSSPPRSGAHSRTSSYSSLSSRTSNRGSVADVHSSPSTSTGQVTFQDVDIRPLEDMHQRSSLLASTHTGGRINPVRDGIYGRLGSGLLRYGSALAAGGIITAGGIAIKRSDWLGINNNKTQLNITTAAIVQQFDPDGIITLM